MPTLVCHEGALAGSRYEVLEELVIGREGTTILVEDDQVSRRHTVVRPAKGGVEVEDLGSTNGTWLNDRRIDKPTLVRPGDVLRIGQLSFEVEEEEDAASEMARRTQVSEPTPPRTPFQPPPHATRRRPSASTRSRLGIFATVGVIVGTGILLVLYFALRGG